MPNSLNDIGSLVGRLLLAAIFVLSGLGKMGAYDGTAGYMAAHGLPAFLLPFTIALETLGGIAIAVGWQTRIAALALAGFSIVAAAIFHADFADQMQMINFMKNLAMAGGLLTLAVHGPGRFALSFGRGRHANLAKTA